MATAGITTWQIYAAGTLACAALSAGLWATVVQPGVQQQAQLAEARANLRERNRKSADLGKSLAADRAKLESLRSDLARGPLHLDPAAKANQRIDAINELGTQHNLTLDKTLPGSAAESQYYNLLPIHVTGTGTYPAFAAFLHQLRRDFPDTGVSSLEAASAGDGKSPNVAFKVELIWYTKK